MCLGIASIHDIHKVLAYYKSPSLQPYCNKKRNSLLDFLQKKVPFYVILRYSKFIYFFNFMSLHINLQICCSICCSTHFFCSLYREINIILRPPEYDYPPSKDEVFLLPLPHGLPTTTYRKIQFPSLLSVEDL